MGVAFNFLVVIRQRAASLLLLLLVTSLLGCSSFGWVKRSPDFPSRQKQWRLPLYEPLTRMHPSVWAEIYGELDERGVRRQHRMLMVVDSGSTLSAVPIDVFSRLDMLPENGSFSTEDASGTRQQWSGALFPRMQLGSTLDVRNIVATASPNHGLIGANVLAGHRWEVDVDQAVFTLGAYQWPAETRMTQVQLEPLSLHSTVQLHIREQTVPLLLDTGGAYTTIDHNTLNALQLPARKLLRAPTFHSLHGSFSVASVFEAELRLGDHYIGMWTIPAHPDFSDAHIRGVLGWDILSEFRFQVEPNTLRLRARDHSLAEQVQSRIARWPGVPVCQNTPGCVRVSLVPGGDQVQVNISASYLEATHFLFGCRDAQGAIARRNFWLEVGLERPGETQEVLVPVSDLPHVRKRWAAGCEQLVLLDVNPAYEASWPSDGIGAKATLRVDPRTLEFR